MDTFPRQWVAEDLALLESLSQVAAAEFTVRLVDQRGPDGDRGLRLTAVSQGLYGLAGVLRRTRPDAGRDAGRRVADLIDQFTVRLMTGRGV